MTIYWSLNKIRGGQRPSKAQLPKQNITKDERKQINALAKRDELFVLAADKGNIAVIKDKIMKMLDDACVFGKLESEPTPKYKEVVVIVTNIKDKDKGKVTLDQYKHIYPTSDMVSHLYGSPKIQIAD